MNDTIDWNALMHTWQRYDGDGADDPHGLRRRVVAPGRRHPRANSGEYAVAAVIICVAAWQLATQRGLDAFVWGFAMLWLTAMALQFSASNRRGLWTPAGETTRDYLELALERIRRRERSLAFAWMLLVVQLALLVAWYPATWFLWPERTWDLIERTPWLVAWVVLVVAAMTGWSVYVRSRCRGERRELERLRSDLESGS
jgi:hypothetical protein